MEIYNECLFLSEGVYFNLKKKVSDIISSKKRSHKRITMSVVRQYLDDYWKEDEIKKLLFDASKITEKDEEYLAKLKKDFNSNTKSIEVYKMEYKQFNLLVMAVVDKKDRAIYNAGLVKKDIGRVIPVFND